MTDSGSYTFEKLKPMISQEYKVVGFYGVSWSDQLQKYLNERKDDIEIVQILCTEKNCVFLIHKKKITEGQ